MRFLAPSIKRKWLFTGTLAMVAFFASESVRSQQPARRLPAFKSEEYLLLGDAMRGAGEPMIALDPTDRKNIIVVATGSLQQIPGVDGSVRAEAAYRTIPRSTITWLAVTHDGGLNWKIGELPILSGTFVRCQDSMADVMKDGTFIAGCARRETSGAQFGMSSVVLSKDKGENWSRPVEIISARGMARFSPGLKPRFSDASPWDRPFTYVDDSTGVIYGVAEGGTTDIDSAPGKFRYQSYITASTDGGKSFGTIYAWDSRDYPEVSRGLGMAAAFGTVAVVYNARSASPGSGVNCPCAVFGLSRNQGKTFSYQVLKGVRASAPKDTTALPPGDGTGRGGWFGAVGVSQAQQNPGMVRLAADPTKAGRFALLTYVAGDDQDDDAYPLYEVSISEDYGQTWKPVTAAAAVPGAQTYTKAALQYSRSGMLGLMWRAVYPDGTYDVWCSISRDGGRTFSQSLRVSHTPSPALDQFRTSGSFGDDIQGLCMDADSLHMVWGDSRSGFLGVWYGRVVYSSFEFLR
jgi:hypothetical protein